MCAGSTSCALAQHLCALHMVTSHHSHHGLELRTASAARNCAPVHWVAGAESCVVRIGVAVANHGELVTGGDKKIVHGGRGSSLL